LTLGLDFDLDFDRQNVRSMSEGRRGISPEPSEGGSG
jgi:hypothetical protein